MLNYEDFKNIVRESMMSYLPMKYHGAKAEIVRVKKVNKELDGLILAGMTYDKKLSGILYVNDMYETYQADGNLENIMKKSAEALIYGFEHASKLREVNFDSAGEKIIFQLVNTAENEAWLKEIPHRSFLDLSFIYRFVVEDDGNGFSSGVITNRIVEDLGYDEETLFKTAYENTKRILPPGIVPMCEIPGVVDIDPESPMPPNFIPMYVLSNKKGIHGAAAIAYTEFLSELADAFDENLYLLPSSIHEWILLPASSAYLKNLKQMVAEVNNIEVAEDERLSYNVYVYDRATGDIHIAA